MTFGSCSMCQYKASSGCRNRRMIRPMSTFPDRFRLDGRTALVTGSGRGLGWEMAKSLAEAGAKVLLHGRSRERLGPRIEELTTRRPAASAPCFDMADPAAMQVEVAKARPIGRPVPTVGERA